MNQVDLVRRRLVDPAAIDMLLLLPRWGAFNRETIADALAICGDAVITNSLVVQWRQDEALLCDAHTLPEQRLLAYLRKHAPAARAQCPCSTCSPRSA